MNTRLHSKHHVQKMRRHFWRRVNIFFVEWDEVDWSSQCILCLTDMMVIFLTEEIEWTKMFVELLQFSWKYLYCDAKKRYESRTSTFSLRCHTKIYHKLRTWAWEFAFSHLAYGWMDVFDLCRMNSSIEWIILNIQFHFI